MLRHAPVSAIGIVSTLALSGVAGLSAAGGGQRFAVHILGFPFGIFSSFADALCVCVVLFHARVLERRFGTARHLTLAIACSGLGSLVLLMLHSAVMPLSPRGSRSFSGAAWLPFVAALAWQYYARIPVLGRTHIVGPLSLSEKLLMYVAALRFAFVVHQAIGAPAAAGLVLLGIGASAAINRLRITLFDEDGPVVAALMRLPGMGGTRQARHATVALPREGGDDLDLPDDVRRQLEAAGALPPTGPRAAGASPPPPPREADAAAAGTADPAAVRRVMELGLGCSERDVAVALHVCGGNVDAAVSFLMEHHQ